ncbi:MAG: UbiA family prenyltransferase, partial [Acidobacteriota bacterium]|nr:UbiA family prenyltransferase [Acidobacteriota bacterium]
MKDYIALTKPRITWLILMSTGVGYFFGLKTGWHGWVSWASFLNTIIGTGLIASGTSALNQWTERVSDCKMHRTAQRPLPSGRLEPMRALIFSTALALVGFLELAIFVNLLSGLLGLFTLSSYLFLY